MTYGEKTNEWNVRQFLQSRPILYSFPHAYKFCATQTFRCFWPILTLFRKGLLRSGETILCFPKLITMEITIGDLLLGMGPHIRRFNRKYRALELSCPAKRRNCLRNAVCKAVLHFLTQYCPMLPYLGHLVRQCNWAGEGANTGSSAFEGLLIVMWLLACLNMGGTVLKYERIVSTALLCQTPLHSTRGQNKGALTIEDVDDIYQLISIGKGGQRVNVCKIPNSLSATLRQRLTANLNAGRVCIPWVKWCPEPTATVQPGRAWVYPPSHHHF